MFKELDYKSKIDEAFNKRQSFINTCEIANESSTKSFGFIKEAFENISSQLFGKKGGKKLINNYIKTVKESKNLLSLTSLYENIRKANANSDIDFFVNNLSNIKWDIDKNINEDVNKLGRVLAEAIIFIGESSINYLPSENKKLDNAIIFLAENNKNKNNIAEYSDAIKVIREHVNTNTKNNVFENTDIDSFAKKMIDEFNTKYSTLSKEEMEIIKKINISENKEIIFNQYKKECLDKLSEYSNKCSDEENQKITEVFNKVKNKSFVAENIGSDICGFIELTKLFD
jgi:hypothetical protein